MSCPTDVCGTGNWVGPKPGDPDTANIILSAHQTYGGIDVSWSYPATLSHAVAHTVLFRGLTSNFALATQQAVVAGNIYYDKLSVTASTQYFYWINMVSVNGTVGTLIGPASAYAVPVGDQIIEKLTGLIDSGVLALALKEKIANITVLGDKLITEINNRLADNLALQTALAAVQSSTGAATSYILNEVTQRMSADSALLVEVNALAVGFGGNAAALVEETTARVTADDAMTLRVTTLIATYDTSLAAIIVKQTALTSAQTAFAQNVVDLLASIETQKAALSTEATVRATADTAMASSITLLVAEAALTKAAVLSESLTRATQDTALASQITTAQASLGVDIVSAETRMTTNITTVSGKVTAIGALYTAKVTVNSLIGGFGVYNDGTSVEAGFDVDTFWVGRTSANKTKPFIINSGVVYIDNALINNLSASKIDTRGLTIKDAAGTVIFGAGTLLSVSSITGLGTLATKSAVGYAELTGTKPPADADKTSLNISAGITGQGTFATKSGLGYSEVTGIKPPSDADRTASNISAGILNQGTLATQSSVDYTLVSGIKPPSNADNTASNTAANISGQGALATKSSVTLGTNVTFPDGSMIYSSDLVSRLSKINSGTISTFMDGAAITNAYIGNAEVSTLKIEGNAVTVPLGQFFGSTTSAALSLGSIPYGTAIIVTVSWSNPNATSHLNAYCNGTEFCNSDITYGASSFTARSTSDGGVLSAYFSSTVHGVNLSAIGCKR